MDALLSGTILEDSRLSSPHPLDPRSLSRRPPKSRPTLANFGGEISAISKSAQSFTAKEALATMGRRRAKVIKKLGPTIDPRCPFRTIQAIIKVEMQFEKGVPLLYPRRRLLKTVDIIDPSGRLFLFNDILVIGTFNGALLHSQVRMDTSLVRYEGRDSKLIITSFNGSVTIGFETIEKRKEWQDVLENASELRKARLDGREIVQEPEPELQDATKVDSSGLQNAAKADSIAPPLPPRPRPKKILSQQDWTPDALVDKCQVCKETTFNVFVRRHHCRLCGRVICYLCSREYPYEKMRIRACSECVG